MRAHFSSFYLWSSRHHARRVQEIEQTGTAADPFPVRHRTYVIEAATDAASFVEAAINEMLKDVFDNQHEFIGSLDHATKQAWRGYWAAAGNAQAVPKYETALERAGVEPMDHQVSHYGARRLCSGCATTWSTSGPRASAKHSSHRPSRSKRRLRSPETPC
jgi:hypothetical protein